MSLCCCCKLLLLTPALPPPTPRAVEGYSKCQWTCLSVTYTAQSTYICRVQSCVWRLLKYWPPTPSPPPSECVLPRTKGGGYTLAGRGGGGGQFLEDDRHRIGLLQYNRSTLYSNSHNSLLRLMESLVLYGVTNSKAEFLEVERKCRWDEVIWGKILRIFFHIF
jgi:hypothetical protein